MGEGWSDAVEGKKEEVNERLKVGRVRLSDYLKCEVSCDESQIRKKSTALLKGGCWHLISY